jgi:hypothetical protein
MVSMLEAKAMGSVGLKCGPQVNSVSCRDTELFDKYLKVDSIFDDLIDRIFGDSVHRIYSMIRYSVIRYSIDRISVRFAKIRYSVIR